MKPLLDDGNEHVGGHGAPDLRLYRVLASSQKPLGAQVLLKNSSTCQRLLYKAAIVRGSKLVLLPKNTSVLPHWGALNAPQMFRVGSGRVNAIKHDALGARDKEGACLMHRIQSRETNIT